MKKLSPRSKMEYAHLLVGKCCRWIFRRWRFHCFLFLMHSGVFSLLSASALDRLLYVDINGHELPSLKPSGKQRVEAYAKLGDRQGSTRFNQDGTCEMIDNGHSKQLKLPPGCMGISEFREGLAAVAIGGRFFRPSKNFPYAALAGSKLGFIDINGKLVIPAHFCAPSVGVSGIFFQDGLAPVPVIRDGYLTWGFIDKAGEFVIAPKFKAADCFFHRRALVLDGNFPFDKAQWRSDVEKNRPRGKLFEQFIHEHKLIGMDEKSVVDFLGKPESERMGDWWLSKIWKYSFGGASHCDYADSWEEIEFKSGKVCRFRPVNRRKTGEWMNEVPKSNIPQEFYITDVAQ